jgi:hypothetical protein
MAQTSSLNKGYIISVSALTFLVPVIAFVIEHLMRAADPTFALFGKWFIFSAVGLRLLVAGIKQSTDPAFTAKQIFHIESSESLPIVRELGFANICFGLLGIASLFLPGWRAASAFASGIYYGIAGAQHLIKKPVGANERFALWTDLVIFAVLAAYILCIQG